MAEKKDVILGISLGTRRLGVAIGTKKELIDWQLKAFAGVFTPTKASKMCRVVERLIEIYPVSAIALKASQPEKRSAGINYCLSALSCLAQSKQIPFYLYSIDDIENRFMKEGKKNKMGFVSWILHIYPELQKEYRKVQSGKGLYYIKLFEAVAVIALTLRIQ